MPCVLGQRSQFHCFPCAHDISNLFEAKVLKPFAGDTVFIALRMLSRLWIMLLQVRTWQPMIQTFIFVLLQYTAVATHFQISVGLVLVEPSP